ncbi:VOC family protein [Cohnella fermenti]|uniref:VOC family protein n=1 Tax=Cohnella fermenti TaxID=2565925 RepID=A0A4S4BF18_9BACL|nr:VOC family protein [Cohnella fermenti]THF72711.1 VOC family protein [Cohnella fermenti]
MPLNPYLIFNGNAREAVAFYADVFGIEDYFLQTFGSAPSDPNHPLPPGTENLVMHALLVIDGTRLMFSDNMPGMPYQAGDNFSITYITGDTDALKQAFDRLKVGGEVLLELQETPWSKYYGQVKDKFGVIWQLNYEEA